MAPNLLHLVTGLQHEVQDGTDSEPPVALPPHNVGTIHCNCVHQLGVQLRCFKKKAGGVNVETRPLGLPVSPMCGHCLLDDSQCPPLPLHNNVPHLHHCGREGCKT